VAWKRGNGSPALAYRRLCTATGFGATHGVVCSALSGPGCRLDRVDPANRPPFTTIYTDQANKTADAWILAGRKRFGSGRLFGRSDGVQEIVSSLRSGDPLYLLPDMNFGVEESLFVPFFDVPAATVPSLSRFARLGRAKVMPVIARMTAHGYTISLGPVWNDVPSRDLQADTALMNRRLEEWIRTMPDQYYWVHKRFKSRPPGLPDLY
jgi:KDO2-lipid IV(A) lauroyltransferase